MRERENHVIFMTTKIVSFICPAKKIQQQQQNRFHNSRTCFPRPKFHRDSSWWAPWWQARVVACKSFYCYHCERWAWECGTISKVVVADDDRRMHWNDGFVHQIHCSMSWWWWTMVVVPSSSSTRKRMLSKRAAVVGGVTMFGHHSCPQRSVHRFAVIVHPRSPAWSRWWANRWAMISPSSNCPTARGNGWWRRDGSSVGTSKS